MYIYIYIYVYANLEPPKSAACLDEGHGLTNKAKASSLLDVLSLLMLLLLILVALLKLRLAKAQPVPKPPALVGC